jgi:hypothetical protein
MARKRSPLSTSSAESESDAEGRRDAHVQERSGLLAVERHVKDDGRSLILYTHIEREHP